MSQYCFFFTLLSKAPPALCVILTAAPSCPCVNLSHPTPYVYFWFCICISGFVFVFLILYLYVWFCICISYLVFVCLILYTLVPLCQPKSPHATPHKQSLSGGAKFLRCNAMLQELFLIPLPAILVFKTIFLRALDRKFSILDFGFKHFLNKT